MLPSFSIPPIGPRQGKVWGTTQLIFAYNGVEAHRIEVRKGGFCSTHYHRHKWNRFVVLKGSLMVSIRHENNGVDETVLKSGMITDVPPGTEHWFCAGEDTEAMELYWVELEAGDIERDVEHLGGMTNGGD